MRRISLVGLLLFGCQTSAGRFVTAKSARIDDAPPIAVVTEPSDGGQAVVAAIGSAARSVHMTMYLLSNQAVIDALVAQKRAGREVRVVLNQQFPFGTANGSAFQTLTAAGVEVVWAS